MAKLLAYLSCSIRSNLKAHLRTIILFVADSYAPHLNAQVFCIFSRARCIFVHLAYIRCIITSEHVLLVPPDDDRSSSFFARIKERVKQPIEAHFIQ